MQQVNTNAEIAQRARGLMKEALRLLDLADEGLAACHLAEAIDAMRHADRLRGDGSGPH